MSNGLEYTHYLSLSYAISELVKLLTYSALESPKTGHEDIASTQGFRPFSGVSLHCHEFGVFYAAARLKKLGVPVNTIATLHATLPGRAAGYNSIQKRRNKSKFVFLRRSLVKERKTLVFFLKTRVCPGRCWDRTGDITP